MPTAFNRALNGRSPRRRRTFYTQSGDFGLLHCTCVRSSWICRYGEQGNGAAPRDARAASFRESARSSRKRRTMRVAGVSGRSPYAWIQIRTKQRFKSEVPGQSIQNLFVNRLKAKVNMRSQEGMKDMTGWSSLFNIHSELKTYRRFDQGSNQSRKRGEKRIDKCNICICTNCRVYIKVTALKEQLHGHKRSIYMF